MKRLFRFACTVFAAAVLSMGFTAAAANDIVDMSNTSHGYVTVNYTSSAKLKVGIQYNGGTTAARRFTATARAARMLRSRSTRVTASTL